MYQSVVATAVSASNNPRGWTPAVSSHVARLLERAAQIRRPELFGETAAGVVYRSPSYHGVRATAVVTSGLGADQVDDLLQYRLAQYVRAGFADVDMLCRGNLDREPVESVGPNDIHLLAGDSSTGEILCYCVLHALAAPAGTILGSADRPVFPVEAAFGWPTFQSLPLLTGLPVARVREASRFATNQLSHHGDVRRRAPFAVGVALCRVLCDCLDDPPIAVIGEVEEHGAKRLLDFFGASVLLLHDAIAHPDGGGWLGPAQRKGTFFPFVCLISDLARQRSRWTAIEAALAAPGGLGPRLQALHTDDGPRSSLAASVGPWR